MRVCVCVCVCVCVGVLVKESALQPGGRRFKPKPCYTKDFEVVPTVFSFGARHVRLEWESQTCVATSKLAPVATSVLAFIESADLWLGAIETETGVALAWEGSLTFVD